MIINFSLLIPPNLATYISPLFLKFMAYFALVIIECIYIMYIYIYHVYTHIFLNTNFSVHTILLVCIFLVLSLVTGTCSVFECKDIYASHDQES